MTRARLARVSLLAALALATTATPGSAAGPEAALDSRAWEMVSPADKGGGEVSLPSGPAPGAFQAAAQGGGFAFASETSFAEAEGAPPQSQYLATRANSAWATTNLSPPLLSATYAGGAYQLFSADLSKALLTSGWRCRDGAEQCGAENPPLSPGAPAGYRNLYLRDVDSGTYQPLITITNAPALTTPPEHFHLHAQGASADLAHVVFATCAALVPEASEVPQGEGCDPLATNLYLWSGGTLELINDSPGAMLGAPNGAISTNAARVYWRGPGGNLYLHQGSSNVQVDQTVGGGGTFEAASTDGSVAFFSANEHLYRYTTTGGSPTDITPAGDLLGVLGASASGSHIYYLSSSGLYLWNQGTTTKVAAEADLTNLGAATGTARVSADGTHLAFLSDASLTGYANVGKVEAFLYDAVAKKLLCASCNPSGKTPAGPASIPPARAAGEGAGALYRPRALSADGTSLFFDSADALLGTLDTDKAPDVYQWRAPGSGGCVAKGGCLGLISSGREGADSFLDASADGSDVYFASQVSLLGADTGARDVYVARGGGGFPEATAPIPCLGDACQGPAPAPEDPEPGTALFVGPQNPAVKVAKKKKQKQTKQKRSPKGKGQKGKRGKGRRAGGRR